MRAQNCEIAMKGKIVIQNIEADEKAKKLEECSVDENLQNIDGGC